MGLIMHATNKNLKVSVKLHAFQQEPEGLAVIMQKVFYTLLLNPSHKSQKYRLIHPCAKHFLLSLSIYN